jgi:CDGSH-type Zn-finger protein
LRFALDGWCREWSNKSAQAEQVADQITKGARLRSGRYKRKAHRLKPVLQKADMAATKIIINNNGSIRVEGDFEIVDPQGAVFGLAGRTAIGLCRSGQSANKPFCDGSHARTGFQDPVVARELPPPKPKI